MKKKLKTLLSVILSFSTLFSAVGCQNQGSKDVSGGQNLGTNVIRSVYTNGVHDYTAPLTDKDFIKNGRCDYTLVVPEVTTTYLRTAQQELCYFFKKATGIDLKTTTDAGLGGHSANTKYISLGETSLLKSTDIDYSYETLNFDGGKIVTKDNNIYIIGGYDTGTLFAVYTFLNITFNLEVYTQDCFVIDENVRDLKLRNYNVIDIPDFKSRSASAGQLKTQNFTEYDDKMYMYRVGYSDYYTQTIFRLHKVKDKYDEDGNWIKGEYEVDETKYVTGAGTDTVLNKKEMMGNHPNWFSTAGNQWCYTARGIEEEFEALTDAVMECVKFALTYYKDADARKNTLNLTAEDNDFWCECPACSANTKKYGTHAASQIIFFNRLLEKIQAWLDEGNNRELYDRKGLNVKMYAYQGTEDPPVVRDENGNWKAVDEKVIPRKDLTINVAPIAVDYQKSIYDDSNRWMRDKVDGWAAITDNLHWYGYSINRSAWLYPYDSFNYWNSDGIQYWASKSDKLVLIEIAHYEMESAWHDLKTYLIAKLEWDCTLDQKQLINDYFESVFGPGATEMKRFLNAQRIYCDQEYTRSGMYKKRSIYNYVHQQSNWEYNQVSGWITICDNALKAIEPYKTTMPEKYAMWAKNIEKEAISPIGILLEQHFDNMNQEMKNQYLNRLRNDVTIYGFDKLACAHQAYVGAVYLPQYIETFVK